MAIKMKLVFALALIFSAVYGALAVGDCPSISSVAVNDVDDTNVDVDWGCRSSVFDKTPYEGGSAEIIVQLQSNKQTICSTAGQPNVGVFRCAGLTVGTTYLAIVQTDATNKATVTFTKQAFVDSPSRRK